MGGKERSRMSTPKGEEQLQNAGVTILRGFFPPRGGRGGGPPAKVKRAGELVKGQTISGQDILGEEGVRFPDHG